MNEEGIQKVSNSEDSSMNSEQSNPLDWRTKRRLRAWELKEQGWTQRQIASELNVSEGAVSQWFKRAKVRGVDALMPKPGRRNRQALNLNQLQRLADCIEFGASAFGFDDDAWTRDRFCWLIENKFNIQIDAEDLADFD